MSRPVTIIGGGLAGLTLGIGLRQRGVPATIYESGDYPRHRVCGEFISGQGQTVLDRLGLLADFEKAGAVHATTAIFVSGAAKSPVRKLSAPALCLSRYKMDALLAAKFKDLGGELHVSSRWNLDHSGEGIVSATGRRLEPVENEIRWFGVKAHIPNTSPVCLEADLEMHISPDGYVGVNLVNDGRVNVCGLFRARPDKPRLESKEEWLLGKHDSSLRERLKNAQFEPQSFCSVAGIQLKPRRASARDICCIGDALTMTPPVTGNGMSMAFESAELAIEPIAEYSTGKISWTAAQQSIARKCDEAFSRRLAWAAWLQRLIFMPSLQNALVVFAPRWQWVWRLLVARTR